MTLPAVGEKLSSPDHRIFHRILDMDVAAPEQSLVIDSAGQVGIGTTSPQSKLEVGGNPGASVGGFASGNLHVTGQSASVNANAVITGHNLFGGNKQLWYLGSVSSSNDNIAIINRQNGSLAFSTNNSTKLTIDSAGVVAINSAVLSTARLLIKSDGTGDSDFPLKLRNSSSVDIFDFRSDGFADHRQQGTTASAVQARPTSASYTGNSISSLSTRAASDAFNHARYTVSSGATEVYKIRGDGSVLISYRGTTSNPITAVAKDASFVGNVYDGGVDRVSGNLYNLVRMRTDIDGTPVTEYIVTGEGRGGFGVASPLGQLHADQKLSAGAIPVLYLDQADVSEEILEIVSTAGVGNAIEAVGAKSLTTTLFIKATINGATVYIQAGTIA